VIRGIAEKRRWFDRAREENARLKEDVRRLMEQNTALLEDGAAIIKLPGDWTPARYVLVNVKNAATKGQILHLLMAAGWRPPEEEHVISMEQLRDVSRQLATLVDGCTCKEDWIFEAGPMRRLPSLPGLHVGADMGMSNSESKSFTADVGGMVIDGLIDLAPAVEVNGAIVSNRSNPSTSVPPPFTASDGTRIESEAPNV
jgi:hypothetical protein